MSFTNERQALDLKMRTGQINVRHLQGRSGRFWGTGWRPKAHAQAADVHAEDDIFKAGGIASGYVNGPQPFNNRVGPVEGRKRKYGTIRLLFFVKKIPVIHEKDTSKSIQKPYISSWAGHA
jgi:hypothetical protein